MRDKAIARLTYYRRAGSERFLCIARRRAMIASIIANTATNTRSTRVPTSTIIQPAIRGDPKIPTKYKQISYFATLLEPTTIGRFLSDKRRIADFWRLGLSTVVRRILHEGPLSGTGQTLQRSLSAHSRPWRAAQRGRFGLLRLEG